MLHKSVRDGYSVCKKKSSPFHQVANESLQIKLDCEKESESIAKSIANSEIDLIIYFSLKSSAILFWNEQQNIRRKWRKRI